MAVKVTDMNLANEVGENDLLMLVQDGENKKVKASVFQLAGESAQSAETLNGYSDTDFVKADGTASNSAKLGGIEAEQYATKDYVDTRGGTAYADPTWCCPKLWMSTEFLPNNDSEHWAFCDGRLLDPEAYPELFAIIGYNYTRLDATGEKATSGHFRIPDMNGRFPLGANLSGDVMRTTNLPQLLLAGKDFDEYGQYIFPQEAGHTGGDPTTVQQSTEQLAWHRHSYTRLIRGQKGDAGNDAAYRVTSEDAKTYTGYEGQTSDEDHAYPYQDQLSNKGMLSMPPYTVFAWIMRIKP